MSVVRENVFEFLELQGCSTLKVASQASVLQVSLGWGLFGLLTELGRTFSSPIYESLCPRTLAILSMTESSQTRRENSPSHLTFQPCPSTGTSTDLIAELG